MKGVIIKGMHEVAVEERDRPSIEQPTDVILKMRVAGLCGSDLHNYRQGEEGTGFILGHEIVGEIVEVGSAVTKFKVGEIVASPFASSCGSCYYCAKGYTARCTKAQFFGQPVLQGCQSEYVRQPLADSSLFPVPPDFPEDLMLLLGDILPTGYSAAYHGRRLLDEDDDKDMAEQLDGVAVVIGCGPVGLCAISSAKTMFKTVFATDLSPARLEQAKKHGAIALPSSELKQAVLDATDGRGADTALEVVGNEAALMLGFDLLRPFGSLSCVGMQMKPVTFFGPDLYSKNVRMQFGRCSVRRFFPAALKVLQANRALFGEFIQHRVRLDQAPEYYDLFNAGKIGKTVFVADDQPLDRR